MVKTVHILFLATVALSAQPAKQQRFDDISDRPVDIARVKIEHYKKSECKVLPTFFTDSTIGPGTFVGIEDATVRSGTILRIQPGTTLLFEPGKRLIIEGRLNAHAEASKPIHLSNVPLQLRYFKIINPDSLWGGMLVKAGATVDLERVKVSCAASGLTGIGEPDTLAIKCVSLANRVVQPFSFDRITTPSGIDPQCFTFHFPTLLPQKTISKLADNKPVEKKHSKRLGLKLGCAGLTVVGAGIAGWGLYQYSHNLDLYTTSKDPEQHTKAEVDKYKRDGRSGMVIAIVGGAAAALSAAGLVMTYTF
jgi:hypothetical protein